MTLLARQRRLFGLALAAILRHRSRHLPFVIFYTALVFVWASVVFCTDALKREARLLLRAAPEIVVQRLVAGRQKLIAAHHLAPLQRIPGVSHVRGRLWGYHFDEATGANLTVAAANDSRLAPGEVAIGRGVARLLGADAGETISLRDTHGDARSFRVAEVFSAASELATADLIEMTPADLRLLLGVPEGFFTDIALRVANENERRVVAAKIRSLVPESRAILREDIARTYEELFDWRAGLLFWVFSSLAAALLVFAWDQAAGIGGEEKREIGILKAVGWEIPEVLALKTWESLIIASACFLGGMTLAYVHVFSAGALLFAPLLKGWAVLYPRFALVPAIDPPQILLLFGVAVVPYLAATGVPCWRAAAAEPEQLLRQA